MARLYRYIVPFTFLSFFTTSALAASSGIAGIIDPLDGGQAIVQDFANGADRAAAVAIQSDGKIVVAGYATDASNNTDFAVVRYNADGTPDTQFGTKGNGKVITPIGTGNALATAVAIQPDGKIVVAGYADSTSGKDFAVARYDTNGGLDQTFNTSGTNTGTPGTVLTDFGGKDDFGQALALQRDHGIVVAGYSNNGSNNDFAVARYTPTGELDTTFGSNNDGKVTTDFTSRASGSHNDDYAHGVAVQLDGKIVVVGYTTENVLSGTPSTNNDFALARYDSSGILDTNGFNTGGPQPGTVVTALQSQLDELYAVAVQPDGRILVAGRSRLTSSSPNDFAVGRYNTDGSRDASFGNQGVTITPIAQNSDDEALALALQPDGKVVLAGYSTSSSSTTSIAMIRVNPDGTSDLTFNGDGTSASPVLLRVNSSSLNKAQALALQPDGKIVVAGFTNSASTGDDFAVARYFAADSPWGITPSSAIGFTSNFVAPPGSNGTTATSDPLVITGLATTTCTGGTSDCIHVPVTVSNGLYENSPGAYTTQMGWAGNGDTFYARQDIAAGAKYGATTTTTLTIGGLVASNNYAVVLCPTQTGSGCPTQYRFTTTIDNAPKISGSPATTVQAGTAYTFRPSASDPDAGDTLTFSIQNKPLWATFDKTSGTLSGTPTNVDIGSNAAIQISVTDSLGDTTSLPAFDIQVNGTSQPGTGNGGGGGGGSGRTGPVALSVLALVALRKRVRPLPRPRSDPRRSMPLPCR